MAAIAHVHDTKHMKLSQLSTYVCMKLGVLALLKSNLAWSSEFDSKILSKMEII